MTDAATPENPFDLTGHVAVVTGGGSGIGLGMAEGLARAGAAVAILGRTASRLETAAEHLRRHARPVLPLVCDVADEQATTAAMARVRGEFGFLDSCFANAGVRGEFTPVLETSLEMFREVTRVDLDGVFVTLREAARQMIEAGRGGSLVAVSSLGAFQGMPRQPAYAASKAGVASLIDSMAVELARHGIRANTVAPGWFDTEMTADGLADERFRERVLPRVPVRRWGAADDIGGVAVYLAGSASRYHTGDVLRIDGGYLKF
ncbi:SDR family oxidoreductase [Mycolicibacterium smegmatis]|uniref:SDR family NAD(P)-dependent oxidoreductase n=1 Tax=Mycolicibacterium smegmatis TaxID=1772 RepID=UPI0005D8ED77|nr:SDR family oxidoreductase [Mycolicibacterium smegmatis]MDF1901613.1 SDR family oxidoreductase [Mycolicibacterium smegmatis]MDF1907957.1 SDR family oxidoreductase [Mycolicibacterium smegmatis]MDF1920469.1 SDR family oxidoreductase [Mycolicibacterium smegmatis]MDF1926485.1 SDR family oxidoreductase [Mycolicibacterium smegmatis]UAK55282.1 SDR family oxidoreductase [Mycolicibacterium smegmatis]